jgi:hypothetical protein
MAAVQNLVKAQELVSRAKGLFLNGKRFAIEWWKSIQLMKESSMWEVAFKQVTT